MYYKLGQVCVKNWGSFVLLQIRADVGERKVYYKLGKLHYYKLRQVLLQIGEKFITNLGRYYKLGQLLKLGHNSDNIPVHN